MSEKNTPVVILAGGKGSRLGELTETIPKPLVQVGGASLLFRIMKSYSVCGFKNFFVLTGHLSESIRHEIWTWANLPKNFRADLRSGSISPLDAELSPDWSVAVIETGVEAETQLRVSRSLGYLKDYQTFFLTYGDGLSDIDFQHQLAFHRSHGKAVTLTAVSPPGKYGHLEINDNLGVEAFIEKPRMTGSVINGGFMVVEREAVAKMLSEKNVALETDVLPRLASMGELQAYSHSGFWKSVDTPKDKAELDALIASGAFVQAL